MSKYSVKYTVRAQDGLRQIFEYISKDLQNNPSAVKIVNNILSRCESLSLFPRVGQVYFAYNGVRYRLIHSGKFRIVYYIKEATKEVIIQDVMYGRKPLDTEKLI